MLGSRILVLMIISLITETKVMVLAQISSTESSAEYLYNVMNQLQEHNNPYPVSSDRTTGPGDADFNYHVDNPQPNLNIRQQKRVPQTEKPPAFLDYQRYPIDNKKQQLLTDHSGPLHNDQHFAESATPYYQVPAPQQTVLNSVQMIKDPAPLGLTRKDLAMLYRKALQQGSQVSLSALNNSPISLNQVPQIIGNQLRLNSGPPGYYYYFYPIKTFMNELQDNQGHKGMPHSVRPDQTDLAVASSEKQMSNPLFTAISGFIGMALLFMASVLFLPRFESLGSRNTSDEFLQLTKVAWEAIEGRNCTERFACELNKFTVKLELSKRSKRLLETFVPDNLRKQMIRMRKSKKKSQDCKLIKCKCADL